MLDRIITYSFYALFLLTPLFWTSFNYELFEFNKMILTYSLTTLIVGCWLLKMIEEKTLLIKRTPLDIPLLLFLTANILSTFFSMDQHISIWGYYSRSNGGLLSLISYLLLYWAFVSNMNIPKAINALRFGLISGFIISLWGISEHFGISPSCIILRGELNASCWVQDVQARVFATLGQPNWLAGYLSMLIFPALYFFLTSKTRLLHTTYYILLITMYLAFTFTYSRGPMLGLIGGLVVFLGSLLITPKQEEKIRSLKLLSLIIGSCILINLLFGSALTSFRLVSKFASPARPAIELPSSSVTQLENGGTESGAIRFIVWQGAWEIFKHYPIFGSGLETFAYSYYQYRPVAHNLTSEWDFLYNKAHNEYLNYLATTGIVGFATYMLVIGTFVFWCIKYYVSCIKQKKHNTYYLLLATCLLAGYVSYLIYNLFLFSVVILALFFFLFPAIVFVTSGSTKGFRVQSLGFSWIYKREIYTQVIKGIIICSILYTLYSILNLWYADTRFSLGDKASDAGNPGRAYNQLSLASKINKNEPLYRSELAFAAASAAVALESEDSSLSAELKDEAGSQMDRVLKTHPNNVSLFRTAIRTYFELASIDSTYINKTLSVIDRAIFLAPTDPKLYYNKALILDYLDEKDATINALKKAYELKPNYLEVRQKLEEATSSGVKQ